MSGCSIAPLGTYAALVEYPAIYDPLLRDDGALRRWSLVLLSGFVAFFLNLCNAENLSNTVHMCARPAAKGGNLEKKKHTTDGAHIMNATTWCKIYYPDRSRLCVL